MRSRGCFKSRPSENAKGALSIESLFDDGILMVYEIIPHITVLGLSSPIYPKLPRFFVRSLSQSGAMIRFSMKRLVVSLPEP